jgi:alginate O-acetyltransferase complex protein AlgJ
MNSTTVPAGVPIASHPASSPEPHAVPNPAPLPAGVFARLARHAAAPHALSGACFALLMAVGLVSNGVGWLDGRLKLADPAPGWRQLMDAEPMQQLAKAMSDVPLSSAAAGWERSLSWLALRDLGPRVREGQRDWLFLADELTPHVAGEASAASRAAEVVALHKRLHAQGIDLLVAVVPDKSRIEAAHLGGLQRPAPFAGRVAQWTQSLEAAGVKAVDLSGVLDGLRHQGQAAFLRTDSHWTEAGAQAAAGLVAQRARALAGIAATGSGWRLAGSSEQPRPGDLVRLAGLDRLPLSLQPLPERAQLSRFERDGAAVTVATAAGKATPAAKVANDDDLFGDADLPRVALIGTSFSRTSQFEPFLARALDARIANFALDGGDFAGAAKAYLASPAFKQTPPRLVIWEIPERVLQADRRGDRVE